jgi:hypothetical protein
MPRPTLVVILTLAGCASSYPQPIPASGSAPARAPVTLLSHTPPLVFVHFTDPKEQAFFVDVPKGWDVLGGMFRFASVDTRAALELVSPGGEIRVTSGDADIPTFTLPSQTLAWAGFGEGSWYSPGYGVRMMVRRYWSGVQFAEEYVRSRVLAAAACSGVTITDRQNRRDLAQRINELYRALGPSVRLDLGEVRFTCTRNGEPRQGYYLAGTLLVGAPAGGIWHVDHLIGYTASPGKAPLGEAVMLRLLLSARENPEWTRMQQNVAASTSRIVSRTASEISTSLRQTFESRWQAEAEAMRKGANMRRGTTDLVDADTGETWNVQSSSRYFWRKPGSDAIVATESSDSPGVGFKALRAY